MRELGDGERARLFERFGRSFEAGSEIYGVESAVEHCYWVQDGRVRLTRQLHGVDRSLTLLGPGDFFGEEALMGAARRQASATAMTDVALLSLDRETFGTLLCSGPEIGLGLVQQIIRRLRRAEEQFENAMLGDEPSRVVNTLLRLAHEVEGRPNGHVLEISPLELSARVGLEMAAVKKTVHELRDGGYVQLQEERVIVSDLGAMEQLYELLDRKEDVRGENL